MTIIENEQRYEFGRQAAIRRNIAKTRDRKMAGFIADHPEVLQYEQALTEKVHARNTFAQDVLAKFRQYGSLSDKQLAAIKISLDKDCERAAAWAKRDAAEDKGPAPSGRETVSGTILSVSLRTNQFGEVEKMNVKLDNNSRVWVTVPTNLADTVLNFADLKGQHVTFTATFKVSDDDPSFAFGSRPHSPKQSADAKATLAAQREAQVIADRNARRAEQRALDDAEDARIAAL